MIMVIQQNSQDYPWMAYLQNCSVTWRGTYIVHMCGQYKFVKRDLLFCFVFVFVLFLFLQKNAKIAFHI